MFRNPLHDRPFADPFVLKFNGHYYGYGTPKAGGLPVLRSSDLVNWQQAGEVLAAPHDGLAHWAPEVAYDNGSFFLYYSTGGHEGEHHQLRVARGDSPTGPFPCDGPLLDPEDPFTIDAHPFLDDDGQWYLFYSRDFLDGDLVGTGIVVDRLVDMVTLAGERATVMRPHAEWHLYERQRRWYDRVWDWYTVEGPFVRKHDGRYWCFYSGGAWKAETYGVSSAVADHPMGPYEPVLATDTADVLRTVPGRVIGPGHGSVAVAPDNVTEYLLYHAWDLEHTGRFLHADRLLWDEGRPRSPGPCTDPQPCPPEPLFRDFFGATAGRSNRSGGWELHGTWSVSDDELRHRGDESCATALVNVPTPSSYLFEINLAMTARPRAGQRSGLATSYQDDGNHAVVFVDPERKVLAWELLRGSEVEAGGVLGRLRPDYTATAYHQLVLRRERGRAALTLDGVTMGAVPVELPATGRVGAWTSGPSVKVAGVTLTELA